MSDSEVLAAKILALVALGLEAATLAVGCLLQGAYTQVSE
jgi:hypothetical protein